MSATAQEAFADPQLVQSFSGVRTVMGYGPDISPAHQALALAYGYGYAMMSLHGGEATFLLGRDPRPTGKALAQALAHGFLAGARATKTRLTLVDLGIITTPLAETAMRALQADGGVMITASHNPLDSNGFKFLSGCGWSMPHAAPPGALLSASMMAALIAGVAGDTEAAARISAAITPATVREQLHHPHNDTQRVIAERAYLDGIGLDWDLTPHCLKPYTLGPVLLDPNGGAGCGIGARVLEHFGVRVIEINAETGSPEHGIDTDGIDAANGRHTLLRIARAAVRERAHFGVAFDYDADRGNLVLPGDNETAILPPQRVATFNIAVLLTHRQLHGTHERPLAIVASDATSLASHRVAATFGAEVFQVETGEINVVTKMAELRAAGYDVPIGVEGANGGTIFASATCRDGLQVALGAAQAESSPALARAMLAALRDVSGHTLDPEQPATLAELVSAVPLHANVMRKLQAPPLPPALVKQRLEARFTAHDWPALSHRFATYTFENFEETRVGPQRTGDESGAWRVRLDAPNRSAFIFLRGSRTEPGVWRLIIDAQRQEDFSLLQDMAHDLFKQATSSA